MGGLSADLGSGLSGLVGSEVHRHHRDVGANLVFARDDGDVGNARTLGRIRYARTVGAGIAYGIVTTM
jgi:hypothetical protein